jgi:hypothetical protein
MDQMLVEIYAHCDETDRQCAKLEARCAELQRRARPHAADSDVIHKSYTPTTQQSAAAMSAESEAAWNRWAEVHIQRAFDKQPPFTKVQKQIIAQVISLMRQQWRAEISEAVGSLRADVTMQSAISKGELAELKGKRDAA